MSKRSANIPPSDVSTDSKIRKLPTFSDKKPANGGVKMKRMGMTALMTATSCKATVQNVVEVPKVVKIGSTVKATIPFRVREAS